MKLNKSEKKILECIRDKKPLPADKKGRHNIYIHRAIVSLMQRGLIHLCEEDKHCISDQGKVDKMLTDIAPGDCPG